MEILILGHSGASGRHGGHNERNAVTARLLSEEFGEPFDLIPRHAWPNRHLPAYAEKCIAETKPGIILLQISDYAFSYPSTPVRLGRLGAPGRWLAKRSLLFADSEASHNRVVRGLRWALQATIGGDTHVSPEEGIASILETVRIAARQEDTLVIVRASGGSKPWGATRRQHLKAEQSRVRLYHALKDLSETLHLPFIGSETPAWANPNDRYHKAKEEFGGDGLHTNSLGAQRSAQRHFEDIRDAYRTYLAARG